MPSLDRHRFEVVVQHTEGGPSLEDVLHVASNVLFEIMTKAVKVGTHSVAEISDEESDSTGEMRGGRDHEKTVDKQGLSSPKQT